MYKRYLEPSDSPSPMTKYMSKRIKEGHQKNANLVIQSKASASVILSQETASVIQSQETLSSNSVFRSIQEIQGDCENVANENCEAPQSTSNEEINDIGMQSIHYEDSGSSCNDDEDDFFRSITDQIIHPNLQCKTADAITMILGYFLRHNLTWVALEDLLDLFHNILGDESRLPKTKYFFKKIFGPNKKAIFHFYCKNCMLYIGTYEMLKSFQETEDDTTHKTCTVCETEFSLRKMNNGHFFVHIPLREQLEKKFLENPEISDYDTNSNSSDITDIFDGELYKSLKAKIGSGPLVTLTMNTDGVRVFKSRAKASLWPIQFFINEIPPTKRFKQYNIILTGIWFGKDANFDLYLKPLNDELKDLDERKICVETNNLKKFVTVRVFLVTMDSVARCKLLKMKQYNGENGCTYCLHPGVVIDENQSSKYILTEQKYSLRTHSSTIALMKSYLTNGVEKFGIVGVSPLIGFKDYDLIRGTVIDYLHCILEGVTNLLLSLWFDSENKREKYYIIPQVAEVIKKNIKKITPLKTFSRKPRSTDERSYWKAHEFKYWLLFYGVPCLRGSLKQTYLNHFSLLSEAIFIFLQSKITSLDFKKASNLLQSFIKDFERLYGPHNMMYNVHLLEHVPKCVTDCGPLWAYSNFNFESNNGSLVNHVNGTTDVEHQIATKYSFHKVLARLRNRSETTFNFLERMNSMRVKHSEKIGTVTLFGNPHKHKLEDNEKKILQNDSTSILAYHKFFLGNDMYYSLTYKRAEQTNDTVVRLKDETVGQIVLIFNDGDAVLLLVKKMKIEPVPQFPAHIKKICKSVSDEEFIVVRAEEVSEKLLLISTTNETFVSALPNQYEGD